MTNLSSIQTHLSVLDSLAYKQLLISFSEPYYSAKGFCFWVNSALTEPRFAGEIRRMVESLFHSLQNRKNPLLNSLPSSFLVNGGHWLHLPADIYVSFHHWHRLALVAVYKYDFRINKLVFLTILVETLHSIFLSIILEKDFISCNSEWILTGLFNEYECVHINLTRFEHYSHQGNGINIRLVRRNWRKIFFCYCCLS